LPAVAPQVAFTPPQTQIQPQPQTQTEDKAVISLILGILSFVGLSILAGIPAIILGRMSRSNIRASSGRLTGEGMATAGMVLGWISVGICVLVVLFILLMILYLMPGNYR
jgi:hypothetical protein